jgi:hypothetical protein
VGFEVFDKRAAGVSKHPRATIQRGGMFSFNKAAYALMGEPEAVELLYDRENERIAFRPVESGRPRSFPIRSQGKTSQTLMVAGRAFTKYYDLDTSQARRYPVEMQGDMLVLDLRGDSEDATGPRTSNDAGSGEGDE